MIDVDYIDRESSMTHFSLFGWSIYLVPLLIISSICIGKTEYIQTGNYKLRVERMKQLLLFFTDHLKILIFSIKTVLNSWIFWLLIFASLWAPSFSPGFSPSFSQFRSATLLKYCCCSSACSNIPQRPIDKKLLAIKSVSTRQVGPRVPRGLDVWT